MKSKKLCRSIFATSLLAIAGCVDQPHPPTHTTTASIEKTLPRQKVEAPDFFVSYQGDTMATVIVAKATTDDQIASLIWLLRDAIHNRSLKSLGISQTLVDNRHPIYTLNIYRGVKCSDRHYPQGGKPPCAFRDQDAGYFMYGSFRSREDERGVVTYNEHDSEAKSLWPRDSPFGPKPYIVPNAKMMPVSVDTTPASFGTIVQRNLAADYSQQVWSGGLPAAFSTTKQSGELKMSADWLVCGDCRKVVVSSFYIHERKACSVGFRWVLMTSFPSQPNATFPLHCGTGRNDE